MSRITPVSIEHAPDAARPLLSGIQKSLGSVPNAFRTLAHAPAALGGYLALSQALGKNSLSARQRETVALATSEVNGCDYCLAAHSMFGRKAGLDDSAIELARRGSLDAVATFARQVTESRGQVSDEQLAEARAAGLSDAQIVDIVAQIALMTLTNYLNNVAQTDVDFPAVQPLTEE
ncbi:carboxymuconolactone decarboxylase family protein [Stutzerimonas marianensis]